MEGKEKITLSEKDHESMGYAFLKAGEKELAKSQFSAARWAEEDIQKALASAGREKPEKELRKMEPEEKRELFKKIAEEFEEHAKRAEGKEWGKKYEEMAKTYRRQAEKIEKNPIKYCFIGIKFVFYFFSAVF